jgi:hypothetical protein
MLEFTDEDEGAGVVGFTAGACWDIGGWGAMLEDGDLTRLNLADILGE